MAIREQLSQTNGVELQLNGSVVKAHLMQGHWNPRLGFLKPYGTYTDEATVNMLGRLRIRAQEDLLSSNAQVVQQVDSGFLDLGVVPAYNAIEGNVVDTLREMVHTKDTTILGEHVLRIDHMLIGEGGEEITEIYSHIQALGQCSKYLATRYPNAAQIPAISTAEAVALVKGKRNAAAIAGRKAAERHYLPIISASIGNRNDNATLFWLVGRGETEPTGNDTTTLVLTPRNDQIGVLHSITGVFVSWGINLTDLKSHPSGTMGKHLFVVSLDGHSKEEHVTNALKELAPEICTGVKILGSYAKAPIPEGAKEPGAINGN